MASPNSSTNSDSPEQKRLRTEEVDDPAAAAPGSATAAGSGQLPPQYPPTVPAPQAVLVPANLAAALSTSVSVQQAASPVLPLPTSLVARGKGPTAGRSSATPTSHTPSSASSGTPITSVLPTPTPGLPAAAGTAQAPAGPLMPAGSMDIPVILAPQAIRPLGRATSLPQLIPRPLGQEGGAAPKPAPPLGAAATAGAIAPTILAPGAAAAPLLPYAALPQPPPLMLNLASPQQQPPHAEVPALGLRPGVVVPRPELAYPPNIRPLTRQMSWPGRLPAQPPAAVMPPVGPAAYARAPSPVQLIRIPSPVPTASALSPHPRVAGPSQPPAQLAAVLGPGMARGPVVYTLQPLSPEEVAAEGLAQQVVPVVQLQPLHVVSGPGPPGPVAPLPMAADPGAAPAVAHVGDGSPPSSGGIPPSPVPVPDEAADNAGSAHQPLPGQPVPPLRAVPAHQGGGNLSREGIIRLFSPGLRHPGDSPGNLISSSQQHSSNGSSSGNDSVTGNMRGVDMDILMNQVMQEYGIQMAVGQAGSPGAAAAALLPAVAAAVQAGQLAAVVMPQSMPHSNSGSDSGGSRGGSRGGSGGGSETGSGAGASPVVLQSAGQSLVLLQAAVQAPDELDPAALAPAGAVLQQVPEDRQQLPPAP